MLESGRSTLAKYTETLGRCGAATPQRLSFSAASSPDGWCPGPDSLSADLLLHCQTDGVQDQIHRLLSSGLISHDTVVIEIPDHGQIQDTLLGVDVRDVRYPFSVRPICVKFSVQQILIPVDLLPHLLPFPAAADF